MRTETPRELIRQARSASGMSQRELARRAATSQPAIARYERGVSTPSWETLARLVEACGQRLAIDSEAIVDRDDVRLAEAMLDLTPLERLRSLRRFTHLHALAEETR